jgi:hypothetical protein
VLHVSLSEPSLAVAFSSVHPFTYRIASLRRSGARLASRFNLKLGSEALDPLPVR